MVRIKYVDTCKKYIEQCLAHDMCHIECGLLFYNLQMADSQSHAILDLNFSEVGYSSGIRRWYSLAEERKKLLWLIWGLPGRLVCLLPDFADEKVKAQGV